MPGILGKKIGMTRIFEEDGRSTPITLVECAPNVITQVKTQEKDGYSAVVLGFSPLKKEKKTKKFYHLKEFKIEDEAAHKKGDAVTVEVFEESEKVSISAISKGKGFQGGIKRHNFARGPETHGSHHHREPGSVGACAKPGRVHKGKKMAGRMGAEKVTLKKVMIKYIDPKKNLLGIKGAVPGPNGGVITIKK